MTQLNFRWRRLSLSVCLSLAGTGALAQGSAVPPSVSLDAAKPAARVLSPAPLPDEQVLSIADLVALAQQHNPVLRASIQSREAARAGVRSAQALPNPALDIGQGRARARLPGTPVGGVSSWSVSQLIESPGLRQARIEGARSGLEGRQQQVAASANELVAQVRLRAYDLLLQIEAADAAADALALLEQIRDRVSTRVKSGEAPRYEIIKADAEVVNARQRVEAARLGVEQARLAVAQLSAGKLPARWRLATSLDEARQLPDMAQLQREAEARNPELATLQAEVQRLQARLRETQASRFPGVELRYSQFREADQQQGLFGLGVRLPLLDQRRGAIDEAAAELARAQTQLDGRRQELALQIESAAAALKVAQLRVDALGRGALPDAEAVLRVAQAAYRFGERGILDVLDAQRLLRSVRSELIDARFRLQAAAVELEFLAGRYALPESMNQP